MKITFESTQVTVNVRRVVRGEFQKVSYYAQLHGNKLRQLNNDKFQLTKEVPYEDYNKSHLGRF